MEKSVINFNLANLRAANELRDKEWDPEHKIDASFRAVELAGEVGELLNVIKKVIREEIGIRGSRASLADLEEEAADVAISLDLLCMSLNIDLGEAIKKKFNKTSDKYNLEVKL